MGSTDRTASPPEHFPRGGAGSKNVELGTKGPDGQPLVVTIRKCDAFDLLDRPEGVSGAEAFRYMASKSVVAPPLFVDGDGPKWADLPLADQMALVTEISLFNTPDPEVTAAAGAFPSGPTGSDGAGGSGAGPGGDSPDASAEPAAPPAGEGATVTS